MSEGRFLSPKEPVLIGHGSEGNVYQSLDTHTGRLVAVKQVRLADATEAEIGRVVQELKLMKQFSHANIVQYVGANRKGSTLEIYMEFVAGGSLTNVLKRYGPLPEMVCSAYTLDILNGISYLHSQRVAHRDLKCENLLLCSSGCVKVADFGLSKVLDDEGSNHTKTVVGSPLYMAPEVASALGAYDAFAADVWTIGMTVLQLLTNTPPFSKEYTQPLKYMFMIANCKTNPPIPEHLSEECQDFLRSCLQIDPLMRSSMGQLMMHPFVNEVEKQDAIPPFSPAAGGGASKQ